MPLPIAHSLLSTSVFVAYRGEFSPLRDWRWIALFVVCGLLPDLDLVTLPFSGFGPHRGVSHSVFFTVALSAVIYTLARTVNEDVTPRLWLFLAAAMTLHPVCDYFTPDLLETRGGVKLFYPLSSAYYESPSPIFMGIELRYLETIFSLHTLTALAYEALLCGGVLGLVTLTTRLRRRHATPTPAGLGDGRDGGEA